MDLGIVDYKIYTECKEVWIAAGWICRSGLRNSSGEQGSAWSDFCQRKTLWRGGLSD